MKPNSWINAVKQIQSCGCIFYQAISHLSVPSLPAALRLHWGHPQHSAAFLPADLCSLLQGVGKSLYLVVCVVAAPKSILT